jgi:hypothetical protein
MVRSLAGRTCFLVASGRDHDPVVAAAAPPPTPSTVPAVVPTTPPAPPPGELRTPREFTKPVMPAARRDRGGSRLGCADHDGRIVPRPPGGRLSPGALVRGEDLRTELGGLEAVEIRVHGLDVITRCNSNDALGLGARLPKDGPEVITILRAAADCRRGLGRNLLYHRSDAGACGAPPMFPANPFVCQCLVKRRRTDKERS